MTADFSRAAWDDGAIPVAPAVVNHNAALEACTTNLTDLQLEAVNHPAGPLLVLAGAGTGKTKCLVSRIAHKIASRQRLPSQILAVTFTRKAAAEMKRRLAAMIGPPALAMDIGTFHATCAKMLRANPTMTRAAESFSTIDDTDQKRIIRDIMRAKNADKEKAKFDTGAILTSIERYKTALCIAGSPWALNMEEPEAYAEYQKILDESDALDYTDIITKTIDLLRDNPEVARYYQTVWKSVLVDEYQDTSPIQELWIDLLSPPEKPLDLTCVGDDDQLIYSWRQADLRNILQFAEKRSSGHIVRLERNFRSVSDILDHANAIIAHNVERHGKVLYTTAIQSHAVELLDGDFAFQTEYDECDWILSKIKKELADGTPPSEIAVITRTGMPLMLLQSKLSIARIPFTLTAGHKFNETKDVRAVVAYMRAARNPQDDLALRVAIEARPRGFGAKSIERLFDDARAIDKSARYLLDQQISQGKITAKKAQGLKDFLDVLEDIKDDFTFDMPLKTSAERAIADIGLAATIADLRAKSNASQDTRDKESLSKQAANLEGRIETFLHAAEESEDIAEFIDGMALSNVEDDIVADAVWLGTIHGAKGLEFERVFLPAWEPGLFPMKSDDKYTTTEREEERRLAYVAITRAKKRISISHCKTPRSYVRNPDQYNKTNRSPYFDMIRPILDSK